MARAAWWGLGAVMGCAQGPAPAPAAAPVGCADLGATPCQDAAVGQEVHLPGWTVVVGTPSRGRVDPAFPDVPQALERTAFLAVGGASLTVPLRVRNDGDAPAAFDVDVAVRLADGAPAYRGYHHARRWLRERGQDDQPGRIAPGAWEDRVVVAAVPEGAPASVSMRDVGRSWEDATTPPGLVVVPLP